MFVRSVLLRVACWIRWSVLSFLEPADMIFFEDERSEETIEDVLVELGEALGQHMHCMAAAVKQEPGDDATGATCNHQLGY